MEMPELGDVMKYSAKIIGITQPIEVAESPEGLLAYCARRSSDRPKEEWGENYEGLLKYCIRNRHWSVFAMVDAVIEVEAPRDICRQILRHKSCDFQEFSQRYSDQITFTTREIRRQDYKNRQNSFDDFSEDEKAEFEHDCEQAAFIMKDLYDKWRERDGAKECCRVFLPEGLTMSNMAIKGSVRSWLTYLDVRDDKGVTQWEHVKVARAIGHELNRYIPTFSSLRGMV